VERFRIECYLSGDRAKETREMRVNVRKIGHVDIIDLSGKITIGEGDVVLRDKVTELLDSGSAHILLNLEKVSYMDSAGIGELVACYKRAKEKDGTVKLLNPSGKVYDLLQLTKLEEVFETYRDEKEALVSF
jgi:anti-sigma B factor antagonist